MIEGKIKRGRDKRRWSEGLTMLPKAKGEMKANYLQRGYSPFTGGSRAVSEMK